jgi:alanyl-tRNA synthetase
MNSSELRTKYLEYFKRNGHKIIPSASLIPENDPTVLFNTAGMQSLVPYLLGQKHPEGTRLADAQKCIRTGDIDEVGDDTHLTFFEMLGNWSLGDYFKKEAIEWSFEFLTKELDIPLERLAVTCFGGDKRVPQIPKDEESAKIWEKLGIKKERIAFTEGGVLESENNWWGPAGKTGPCGPDTEMFYWKPNDRPAPENFDAEDKNWVEIWNDVLMQYIKTKDGEYVEATQKNIDTGMGLERTLAVLNGKETVYQTDLFVPITKKVRELAGIECTKDSPCGIEHKKPIRIVSDHLKAATFIIGDDKGVSPSNLGQGYIVRRLIRRAVRFGKKLGIEKKNWTKEIAEVVIEMYKDVYPELERNKNFIIDELTKEEEKFELTLEKGLKEFEKLKEISGKQAFDLYQTYGFPIEITQELAKENGINIDIREFEKELEKHQELSRTASAGMFKGGLADNSEQTTKLHTAAHLMLAGLRKVLGDDVYQKGSNITAERLRFDFSHKEKMSSGELNDVENFVNDIIKKDLPVVCQEMSLEDAKKLNAMGVFESKYGQMVKVYTVGEGDGVVSREICGGPHVDRTGILGHFKILKEESSSSGVRRIKAILE